MIVGCFPCQRSLYVFKLVSRTVIVLDMRSIEVSHGPTALDGTFNCVIYGTYPGIHVFLRGCLIDALILWGDDLKTEPSI